MPQVRFIGSEVTVEAALGETLLSCIRRAGLRVDSTYDGRGRCGKCRVVALGELSPLDDRERHHLQEKPQDVRLACRALVQGNVSVRLSDTEKQLQTACGSSLRKCSPDSPVKQVELPNETRDAKPYAKKLPFSITDLEILSSGWPDNVGHLNLIAWSWTNGDSRCLIVVYLSDTRCQGQVRVPRDNLKGRMWRLEDAITSSGYERDGDQLAELGLYVDLPAWGFHFLIGS